jgi:Domain of unknown function (DUF4153)
MNLSVTGVPTLRPMLDGAWRGAKRFPLTLVSAAAATVVAIYSIEGLADDKQLERLLITAILGLSLFTGLRLLTARWDNSRLAPWVGDAIGLALLATVFAMWPHWSEPVRFARTTQLLVVFHLFVAVAPYVTGAEGPGFWAYNRALFERIIVSVIYTEVLFAGVAIALLALEKLFGLHVPRTAYVRLWAVAALFFNTWFFVARIPTDLRALDAPAPYPRGLAVFTRFALLPIVAAYLLILTVYFVKVLVTWQWPSGWIGWLVSAVAAGGLFSLLLVHPLAAGPGDRWIRTYARGFYVLLLPAIVMLWLAVWQRVEQYGVTERRYFLIVLSVWLAGIALYQLVTRSRGIRIIPASLCVVGLLTFAGPWGAYRVSERSQVHRLADLLGRHGMLAGGRVVPATSPVPLDDRREMSAVLQYLAETHGYGAIAGWFADSLRRRGGPLADLAPREAGWDRTERLVRALGVEPVASGTARAAFWFTPEGSAAPLDIAGHDVLLRVDRWRLDDPPNAGWAVRGNQDDATLTVWHDGARVAVFALDSLAQELRASGLSQSVIPTERMRVVGSGNDGQPLLFLRVLGGRIEGARVQITTVAGEIVLAGR